MLATMIFVTSTIVRFATNLRNLFSRSWANHIYYGPAASRKPGPCNHWVILRFSCKTCRPTNTTWHTNICFLIIVVVRLVPCIIAFRQVYFEMFCIPILPLQWVVLLFRTYTNKLIYIYIWYFLSIIPCPFFSWWSSSCQLQTGTIVTPYVRIMLFLHILILSYTFPLHMASAFSISVQYTLQASKGFNRGCEGRCPDFINLYLYLCACIMIE